MAVAPPKATYTYGATAKALARLGLPVLVTQLGAIAVGFADTLMIGRYGTDELAAAAFVNNIFMVPIVMQIAFAGGVTPLVGALFGRGDSRGVGRMLRLALRLNILVSLVLTAVMACVYPFLDHMGQDPALMPLVKPYYLLVLASMAIGGVFFACQQTSNGVNDTSTPMWIILGANLMNVAGNYMLIFGNLGMPELGLTGAGTSTLTARVTAAVVIFLIVTRSRRFKAYREGYRSGEKIPGEGRRLFNTSWPVMFQGGIECFLWAFGAVVCGWYGKHQLAAYQVVLTINQIGFMTYMSVATAVAIRVANFAGTSDKRQMRMTATSGLALNLVLGLLASLTFIFLGNPIVSIFTSDTAVRTYAALLIFPLVLYQFGDAMQITYGNALRGTSNVAPMFGISLICYLAAGVPAMLLLADLLGMESRGVYFSFSVAVFLAAWLYLRAFRLTLNKL